MRGFRLGRFRPGFAQGRGRLESILAAIVLASGLAGPALAQSQLPQSQFAQSQVPTHQVPTQSIDPFGQETNLPPKTIVYVSGSGSWDKAFGILVEAFKKVDAYLDKAGLKSDGPPMTIYTSTDDAGFDFQAAIPLADPPKDPPGGDIKVGKSPEGRVLKFVHRGSYDELNQTYEAITNYLDEKGLDAKELLIEEYVTDPVTSPPDKLVVNVFVPLK